jgi:hypothetical protein
MKGRAFLGAAREMAAGTTEDRWRTAAGRAYYALMLEGREALRRWGFSVPPRHNVHAFVRLRLVFAADSAPISTGPNHLTRRTSLEPFFLLGRGGPV